MDLLPILYFVVIGIVLLVVFFLLKRIQDMKGDIQQQMNGLQQNFSQRLDSNVQTVASHLGIITNQINNTTNVVTQVEGRLGQMQEASRQIFDLAKQISNLHNILQSPKMRGGLGEFLLTDLVSQCLDGSSYKEQFRFAGGTIVDMALFVGQRTLCVDSKFPLENFRRMLLSEQEEDKKQLRKLFLNDVKKHVNDISGKYILPDEGTFDFALMFIPAENVYYELIVKEDGDLYSHCLGKKVIPVSPNTFYAYLQVILMGLRGFQISEQAKRILGQLQQLNHDLGRFETDFSKTGVHLRNAQSSFEGSVQKLGKLRTKIETMGTTRLSEEEQKELFAADLKSVE
jgi:DNA recombination protein RmuC